MAGDVSFDVVSDFDRQELVNALDQVRREIATRYDFKGAKADLELGKEEITLRTDSESRAPGRSGTSSSRRRSGAACRSRSSTGARSSPPVAAPCARRSPCGGACRTTSPSSISKLIRDEYPKVKSADPGGRGAGQRQEQGRAPAGHRPPARGGRGVSRGAPVRELPLR